MSKDIVAYIGEHRRHHSPFEVAVGMAIPDDPRAAKDRIDECAEAGVTWARVMPGYGDPPRMFQDLVRRGPPGR